MKNKRWNLKGGALREATTLLSGSVVAQAIAFVAYFVLLRIYSAEDYGLYSIFASYIEVIIILSTCKYELAIVPAATDREAATISRFALRLNAIVSLALLAILSVLTLTGNLPGKFARLGTTALLIAPTVFFSGTTRIYGELYNRHHRYRTIAAADVTASGGSATLKTLFGLAGLHIAGMPLGALLGQAAANTLYRARLGRDCGWRSGATTWPADDAATEPRCRRQPLSAYRNYPLYVAPKDLVNSLSANLPFIWLALHFDNAVVGLFGLAVTFIVRPTQTLGTVFERVLSARSAEAVREGRRLTPMLRRFLLPLLAAALAAALLLWFVAAPLFALLFGGGWAGCAPYVRALLPWAVANVGALSLMYMPNIFGTQRTELVLNVVRLLLRAAAIAVGIATANFLLAVWLFSAASALVAVALTVWYVAQARSHDSRMAAPTA